MSDEAEMAGWRDAAIPGLSRPTRFCFLWGP